MSKLKSDISAEQLVKKNQIFEMTEGNVNILFLCKGTRGKVYEVIYNKISEQFMCDCPNIRLSECKHVKAAKLLMAQMTPD